MMFGDLDHFYDDEETLDLLRRYKEMLLQNNTEFFDLYEFESIIDYFTEQYNFNDAIIVVCIAIKQHPNASSMKLRYAQLLIETLKPGKALRILRSIGTAETDNYEFFLARGIALNMTGKTSEAEVSFNQSLKMSDGLKDEIAYSISQSYMQYGAYPIAIKYLLLAYHYNKTNILVLYDVALCFEKLNETDRSISFYRKYLDIDPFAEHVWHSLGNLYTKNSDFKKAVKAYDFSLALNPQFVPAYFSKADMYLTQNKYLDAISVYLDLLNEDNDNTQALCNMGNCHVYNGNYLEALRLFKVSLDISYECSDAWYGLSMVYFRQKKYNASIGALKKAISVEPNNDEFWFMLGEIYCRLRRLNKALDAYSRADDLNPFNLENKLALAQILFRKKKIQEAILVLIQCYNQEPDNVLVNYRLAAYYAYLHNMFEAKLYFKRALTLNFHESAVMFKHFPKTRSMLAFKLILSGHHAKNE
jgi:tetratricopeptide (TPR) repeat protein